MSTSCRHVHVTLHCFILTEACSCRLELACFAGKISKNRLVCKSAAALAYYGSCRLLVMFSRTFAAWFPSKYKTYQYTILWQPRNKNNNRTHVANNKIYVAALQSLELPELDLAKFLVIPFVSSTLAHNVNQSLKRGLELNQGSGALYFRLWTVPCKTVLSNFGHYCLIFSNDL